MALHSQSFQNTVFGRNQFLGLQAFEQTDVRDVYCTWLSSLWLAPKDIYGDNRAILEIPSQNYTLSEVEKLLCGDQTAMFHRSFVYNTTADPNVLTTRCRYCKRVSTFRWWDTTEKI
jgi:hypothetical protein